ncbi:MAG TPA: TonB-dependent receptor [Saprospiraceae bacterium]|nr:TonB-dependent receptor [Saprospiraceae bacterium]
MKVGYFLIIPFLPFAFYTHGQGDLLAGQIETVTIQEKRLQIDYSDASRTIQIIDKDEIRAAPVQSVAELLQYVAGLDIRRRGIHGIQADVSIRGGTFDQTLLLINGVSMADPQTGHHLMNIPVDLESIERIEVLKGPAARRYGQNAYAGAINIVTNVTDETTFGIFGDYSAYNSGRLGMNATLPFEKARHHISYSRSFSDGYRHNTDYDMYQAYYRAELDAGADKLSIQAGFSDRAFGANGFYASPSFTEQYEEIQTSLVSAAFQAKRGKVHWNPIVYWRRNKDEYIFVRDNPSIYRNLHIGNTYGTEVNGSVVGDQGALGFGLEFRHDDLVSNNLGERKRTTFGANAEYKWEIPAVKLDVSPGIGIYHYSDFGFQTFPGIDLGWSIHRNFKAFTNVGYTWRVPTFTDLFYEDPANKGNPDLTPEKAFTTEIGFKWINSTLDIQIAGFKRNSSNLIDWSKSQESEPWFPSNIGRVIIKGIETTAVLDLMRMLSLKKPAFLNVGYTFLDGENQVDAPISRYALDLLSHQLNVGVRYSIFSKITHSFYLRWIDRINLDNYTLIDTRVQYHSGLWTTSVFINNLFNQMYTETNLVPMPGRWVGMSASYSIKGVNSYEPK